MNDSYKVGQMDEVVLILRNKVDDEEKTLQLIEDTWVFADDIEEHEAIFEMQKGIVDFYKGLLDKVETDKSLLRRGYELI